jgi:putative hydrolase of the HAD superfamily
MTDAEVAARRPEVLLFDLGGVLVDNVTFDELPALLPEPIEDGELRRRWLFSPAVRAFERGEIAGDAFAAAFVAEWRLGVSPSRFLQIFASWPRGPYPGALELLDRLRDDYRLALLSNCNPVHWERMTGLRERVHSAFSSHLLGVVKPDASSFSRVADALGVAPAAVCFFDDSPPNVEAARAVGMQAHLTRGVAEVELALRRLAP